MISIAEQIEEDGFSQVDNDLYKYDINDLFEFQSSYFNLDKDKSHGGRYRSYIKLELFNNIMKISEKQSYMQSKEYNNEDGNKIRSFSTLDERIYQNKLLQNILEVDIQIAKLTNEVDFKKKVIIGLHQIRYCSINGVPSYSSPLGFHRDDENLVFIHLLNLSANSIGGDNFISKEKKRINYGVQLVSPLDTLVVSKKYFHEVTPISSINNVAFRDILLVNLENEG